MIAKRENTKLSLAAETIKDQMLIEMLLWVDQVCDWKDLLVYLQKKYENV
jgi:hypothetical protein